MLGDHSELMYTPDDFLVTIAMSNNKYEEFGLNRAISTAKNPRHVSQVICHSFYDRPVVSSSFFFFPRLISAVGDWMSAILAHMVWP